MAIPEQLEGYDWDSAFEYAGEVREDGYGYYGSADVRVVLPDTNAIAPTPFSREDIAELWAYAEGENDGPSWIALGLLNDNRWFCLEAGCDYTGWDCQAGGSAFVATSLGQIIDYGIDVRGLKRLTWVSHDVDDFGW